MASATLRAASTPGLPSRSGFTSLSATRTRSASENLARSASATGIRLPRVHRRDHGMARGDVQARAGRPTLADQDGACGLRERRGVEAHQREVALLGPTGQEALCPVGRDCLETVDPAVDVLQRHDESVPRVHAQGERRCLLGDQIGIVLRGGTRASPDPGCARGGLVRPGWRSVAIVIDARLGTFCARRRCRRGQIVRRHFPGCRTLAHREVTGAHADPVRDPIGRALAGHAEVAADEVGEPAAPAFLVVEPHPRPRAGNDDRKAALAAPAPFLTRSEGRLAQKLHRQLRHAGAQLRIEGSPVPPAHRRPRGTGARTPVGRRAAAVSCRGWRRRADTGAAEPDEGRCCPRFCRASDHPRDVGTGPPGHRPSLRKGVTPSGKNLK